MKINNNCKIFALYLLLAGFLFWPLLQGKVVMANWDRTMIGLPSHLFASQMLKTGQFPLWNPHLLSGYNYCGSGQFHLFNPAYLIAYLFPKIWLLHIFAFLAYIEFALSGMFTYLFARQLLKTTFWPAIAGIMYMFSGSNIAMLTLADMGAFHVMFLFPILLYTSLALCEEGRFIHWFLTCLTTTLIYLGGLFHLCYFSVAITLVFCLYHNFFHARGLKKSALLISAVVLGLLIASVRLAPFFDSLGLSTRSGMVSGSEIMNWVKATSVPAIGVLRLLMPEFFGYKLDGFFMQSDPGLNLNHIEIFPHYVGIIGLLLSLLGICRIGKKNLIWLLIMLGMLIFAVRSPLSFYLERYILKGRQVLMCRFSLMLPMCLAVLAGYGGIWLTRKPKAALKALFIFIPVLVFICIFSFLKYPHKVSIQFFGKEASLQFMSMSFAAAILLLTLVLCVFYYFRRIPKTVFFGLLLIILSCDLAVSSYVDSNDSQDFMSKTPLVLQKIQPSAADSWDNRVYYGTRQDFEGNSVYGFSLSFLMLQQDIAGGEAFCYKRYGEFINYPAKPQFRGNCDLWLTPRLAGMLGVVNEYYPVLPKVKLFNKYIVVDKGRVLETLFFEDFNPHSTLILEEDPDLSRVVNLEPNPPWVSITDYKCNSVTIESNSNNENMLLLLDRNEEGWNARIDGKRAKIYFADYIWRAVKVGQGRHIINFYYFPPGLYKGIVLSALGILILIIVTINRKRF